MKVDSMGDADSAGIIFSANENRRIQAPGMVPGRPVTPYCYTGKGP